MTDQQKEEFANILRSFREKTYSLMLQRFLSQVIHTTCYAKKLNTDSALIGLEKAVKDCLFEEEFDNEFN